MILKNEELGSFLGMYRARDSRPRSRPRSRPVSVSRQSRLARLGETLDSLGLGHYILE
jgi:hypothetical protein